MNPILSIQGPVKWKRGDVHPTTGLVFWQRTTAYKSGEYWVSAEKFDEKLAAHNSQSLKWVAENPEKISTYRRSYAKENQPKITAASKLWKKNNPERHKETTDAWRNANRPRLKEISKRDREKNKESRIAYDIAYSRKRRKESALFALVTVCRNRTAAAFRKARIAKNGRTQEILGCEWGDLKAHIERQFTKGMNWGNRGEKGWHIDHIIPLCKATNERELKRLCHYTNLRPMWAAENLAKGDKEITHQMALL